MSLCIHSDLIFHTDHTALCYVACFQFMVQSQMSRLRLTKIITVLPFFLVINQSNRKLRYMEENPQADLWLDIAKGDVSACVACSTSVVSVCCNILYLWLDISCQGRCESTCVGCSTSVVSL